MIQGSTYHLARAYLAAHTLKDVLEYVSVCC